MSEIYQQIKFLGHTFNDGQGSQLGENEVKFAKSDSRKSNRCWTFKEQDIFSNRTTNYSATQPHHQRVHSQMGSRQSRHRALLASPMTIQQEVSRQAGASDIDLANIHSKFVTTAKKLVKKEFVRHKDPLQKYSLKTEPRTPTRNKMTRTLRPLGSPLFDDISRRPMHLVGVEENQKHDGTAHQALKKTLGVLPKSNRYLEGNASIKKKIIVNVLNLEKEKVHSSKGPLTKKQEILKQLKKDMDAHGKVIDRREKVARNRKLDALAPDLGDSSSSLSEKDPESKVSLVDRSTMKSPISPSSKRHPSIKDVASAANAFSEGGETTLQFSPNDRTSKRNMTFSLKSPGIRKMKFDHRHSGIRQLEEKQSHMAPCNEEEENSEIYSSQSSIHQKVDQEWNRFPKSKKYILKHNVESMLNIIDKKIEERKQAEPEKFRYDMQNKSLALALKPRKGHKFQMPCYVKLRGFYFLNKWKGMSDYEKVNLDDPRFRVPCDHDYSDDRMENFDLTLAEWMDKFSKKLSVAKKKSAR